MNNSQVEDWEKFVRDKLLISEFEWDCAEQVTVDVESFQEVMRSLLSTVRAEERGKIEKSIGMLRQWLNEDHITDPGKLVTNEQIKSFFDSLNHNI